MKRLSVIFLLLGAFAVCAAGGVGECFGQVFGKTKSWKDIGLLPTNVGAQNIKITLSTDKDTLNPGDELKLTFSADRECYLTLMDMGTSGRILRLWPNDYSGSDNRIEANVARKFPGPGDNFRYRIAGPTGTERIVAYATSEKGKILSEGEFQQLQKTGFKEYKGTAKDLAIHFQRGTENVGSNISWGTAQVNIAIGSTPAPVPPTVVEPSKTYLLAIAGHGVFDQRPYDDTVVRIADTFKTKAAIDPANMRVLRDDKADFNGVSGAVYWLVSTTQPEDTVIIYFSGHGGNSKGEGFLVLYPGEQKGVSFRDHLRRNIFVMKDKVGALLKKIPARKKILIVDSCHSRAIVKHHIAESPEFISDYLPTSDSEEDWSLTDKSPPPDYGNDHEALLASARKHESSYSSPKLNGGVFTYYLIDAIKRGSPNLEGAFSTAKDSIVEHYMKGGKNDPPIPCIVDPHGVTRELRFAR